MLIAEDSELNRDVLARLLKGLGCRVSAAADGEEALALWKRRRFDLLLLDARMPGRDGLAVARAVRADENGRRRTPIVLATAALDAEVQGLARQAGVDDVIEKPFGLEDLTALLDRVARPPRSPRPSASRESLKVALAGAAPQLFAAVRPNVDLCMARLRAAVGSRDMDEVAEVSHRLVGLAAQFDLSAIRDGAARLEAASQAEWAGALTALEEAVAGADWSAFSLEQSPASR